MTTNMFMSSVRSLGAISIFIALTLALQSCASAPPRNAVPEEQVGRATIPGGSIARMWGDQMPADAEARFE